MIIKLGEPLGYGGFVRLFSLLSQCLKHIFACQANVYRGLDPKDATPLAIAIKKSRVSQRIRRPTLQHEASLLRALMDHPAIPRILAYGHLPHFEYLAMELLGNNLEQVTPTNGMSQEIVARISVQLVRFSFALNLRFSRKFPTVAFCAGVRPLAWCYPSGHQAIQHLPQPR